MTGAASATTRGPMACMMAAATSVSAAPTTTSTGIIGLPRLPIAVPTVEAEHGRRVEAGEHHERLGDAELHLAVGERVEAGREGERGVQGGVDRRPHEEPAGHGATSSPSRSSGSARTRVSGICRNRAPVSRKRSTSPVV